MLLLVRVVLQHGLVDFLPRRDSFLAGSSEPFLGCSRRLSRTLEMATFLHLSMPQNLAQASAVFRALFFKNALFSLIVHHVAFPLPFKYGCPVTLLSVLVFLPSLTPASCGHIAKSGFSIDSVGIVSEVLTGISDSILGGVPAAPQIPAPLPEAPCEALMRFLYIYFGFFVPVYLLWCSDRVSRENFVNSLLPEDRKFASVRPLLAVSVATHVSILILLLGCLWRALIDDSWHRPDAVYAIFRGMDSASGT